MDAVDSTQGKDDGCSEEFQEHAIIVHGLNEEDVIRRKGKLGVSLAVIQQLEGE